MYISKKHMNGGKCFIIGAGASYDYGLPTGNELIRTISQMAKTISEQNISRSSDGSIHDIIRLNATYYIAKSLPKFSEAGQRARQICNQIRRSLCLSESIDNFLNEQNDEHVTYTGKLLIFASILLSEQYPTEQRKNKPISLFNVENHNLRELDFLQYTDFWLNSFFRMLTKKTRLHDIEKRLEDTTLIIFNYDRCIEHFLFYAFKQFYQISDNDAENLVNKINIIHPYGYLGTLPWQSKMPYPYQDSIDFGDVDNLEQKLNNVELIRTFNEAVETKVQNQIRQSIASSPQLIFLGFGYHDQNMKLLGTYTNLELPKELNCGISHRQVLGTTLGLSKFRNTIVENETRSFCKIGEGNAPASRMANILVLESCTAKELIEEYGDAIY